MNRDPFLRLALIVAATGYAIGISAVWDVLGWPFAVAGIAAGVGGAVLLTLEPDQRPGIRPPTTGGRR